MISADILRKRTNIRQEKFKKITWRKIGKTLKKTSKEGNYYVSFREEDLTEENIEILTSLGYSVTLCKSCFLGLSDYYNVSWEHPQEYWEEDRFRPD